MGLGLDGWSLSGVNTRETHCLRLSQMDVADVADGCSIVVQYVGFRMAWALF